MIEKTVIDYLNANASVTAYAEMPKNPPASFLIVEKTGSGKSNHINSATIAIQSYASSMFKAAQLNTEIIGIMEWIIELDNVSKVSLTSDYNYTDTETKQYRYQAIFEIKYY